MVGCPSFPLFSVMSDQNMSSILNTLTRQDLLKVMKVLVELAGPNHQEAFRESYSCQGISAPGNGLTAFGMFLRLRNRYNALDPNNIETHIRRVI